MRREWIVAVLVFVALAAFVGAGIYFKRTGEPEPIRPWPAQPAAREKLQNRCKPGLAQSLNLVVDGTRVWTRENVEVVRSGEDGESLLLSELLRTYPAKTTLLVIPCVGDARRFSADELLRQPQRFSLRRNNRGLLKLVDEEPPPDAPRLQLKNLYAVEILD